MSTEICHTFHEVCGKSIMDLSTISRWSTTLHEGRDSIENDPRSGQPKVVPKSSDWQPKCSHNGYNFRQRSANHSRRGSALHTLISTVPVHCILTSLLEKQRVPIFDFIIYGLVMNAYSWSIIKVLHVGNVICTVFAVDKF